jgi:hypothetical protein
VAEDDGDLLAVPHLGVLPKSYSVSNLSCLFYKFIVSVKQKVVLHLLEGTELLNAAFLQNVVTEALKGFFKCLNKEKFENETPILIIKGKMTYDYINQQIFWKSV